MCLVYTEIRAYNYKTEQMLKLLKLSKRKLSINVSDVLPNTEKEKMIVPLFVTTSLTEHTYNMTIPTLQMPNNSE